MKIANHLSKEQIQKFNQLRHNIKKHNIKGKHIHTAVIDEIHEYPNRPVKENLSLSDWEEIMGIKRDTYKRVGGAVRRK